jgi:PTH1 family peptidyl-tRNA hydrolase
LAEIKLIAGLGNPGASYSNTRHNAGIWCLRELASSYNASFAPDKTCKADIASFNYNGKDFKLLIPKVYMNVNGVEISKYMRYFKLQPENLLVLHDELDFPPGVVRFKSNGGCAGHNGLKSIKAHLGSSNFHRIRIGIGHPGHADQVSDFVLSKPSLAESDSIRMAISEALSGFHMLLDGQLQDYMQDLHS